MNIPRDENQLVSKVRQVPDLPFRAATGNTLLQLLQLADSAIPIGATAHSFGLETLVSDGVLDPANLEDFLTAWLEEAGAQEAFFLRRAYTGNPRELSAELSARKPASESREASLKLGRRFAQLVNSIANLEIEPALHYSIAFGSASAALGIDQDAALLAYLQQSVASLVSACQRLMPLGQVAAARVVWNLKPAVIQAAAAREISCFTPLLEIASMRHPALETRLFIS
jgi:urease accessory protein